MPFVAVPDDPAWAVHFDTAFGWLKELGRIGPDAQLTGAGEVYVPDGLAGVGGPDVSIDTLSGKARPAASGKFVVSSSYQMPAMSALVDAWARGHAHSLSWLVRPDPAEQMDRLMGFTYGIEDGVPVLAMPLAPGLTKALVDVLRGSDRTRHAAVLAPLAGPMFDPVPGGWIVTSALGGSSIATMKFGPA